MSNLSDDAKWDDLKEFYDEKAKGSGKITSTLTISSATNLVWTHISIQSYVTIMMPVISA